MTWRANSLAEWWRSHGAHGAFSSRGETNVEKMAAVLTAERATAHVGAEGASVTIITEGRT